MIEFLWRIERTKALVYSVDAVGEDERDPVNDLRIIGKELKKYGSSGIFGFGEAGDGDGEGEYGEELRRPPTISAVNDDEKGLTFPCQTKTYYNKNSHACLQHLLRLWRGG